MWCIGSLVTIFFLLVPSCRLNLCVSRVSPDQVHLASLFGVSIQAMSRALGTSLVTTLAIATMVWSMISVKWGKRPVYLASTLMILAGSLVAGEGIL